MHTRFPELQLRIDPPPERPPSPPPFVANESHVRTLFDMGLAVRARALQVLEQVGNDLPDAIALLLATEQSFNPTRFQQLGFTH